MRPADSPSRSTIRSKPGSRRRRKARTRRITGVAVAGVLLAPALAACGQGGSGSVNGVPVINWYIGAQAGGWIEDAIATCNDQNKGKFVIKEQELPSRATDQREQIVRRLAANDSSVDLIGMDVIWTAEFANAGWLYAFPDDARAKLSDGVLKGPLASATYQGKLYGAPYTSNTQLLWYRKSLVPPPGKDFTWDQMVDTGRLQAPEGADPGRAGREHDRHVQRAARVCRRHLRQERQQGPERHYRPAQKPTEIAPGGAEEAGHLLGRRPGAEHRERGQQPRRVRKGRTRSTRSTTRSSIRARRRCQGLQAKLGWARYPEVIAGKPSKPPLGGFNIGISSHSKHHDLDVAAAECIVQPGTSCTRRRRAVTRPTLSNLYDKIDKKQYPFAALLRQSINDAAPRPVSPAYNDLSLAVQETLVPLRASTRRRRRPSCVTWPSWP